LAVVETIADFLMKKYMNVPLAIKGPKWSDIGWRRPSEDRGG
jgi:hypothetical protein